MSGALANWNQDALPRLGAIATDRMDADAAGHTGLADDRDRAYVVLLAALFQRYCRELHDEAVQFVSAHVAAGFGAAMGAGLTAGRGLDVGNATGDTLRRDFHRVLGFEIWQSSALRITNEQQKRNQLAQLLQWRNTLAHGGAIPRNTALVSGTAPIVVPHGETWRDACADIAAGVDVALADHLNRIFKARPW